MTINTPVTTANPGDVAARITQLNREAAEAWAKEAAKAAAEVAAQASQTSDQVKIAGEID